ncbi:hypothetical protein Tco_0714212 [Tanacetum coccineum]
MVAAAKLPVLNPEEFELWKMRIEQYFLITDYALWEVIVNGDSPLPKKIVNGVEQTYPPTTAKENYQDNDRLDQTYDRFEKLISQLEILGETISQEDMNLKFLRSLPLEWKTHTLIWRNKPDLDTLSMDDLYNNLKVYEIEVKGSSRSNQNSQNVAFVSSNNSNSSNQAYGSNSVNTNMQGLKGEQEQRTCKEECDSGNNRDKSLVAQDGLGYDWSDQAEEGPTNFALMAYTSSSPLSSSELRIHIIYLFKASLKS